MISYISGIYAGHSTDAVVIECGGIGFCIRVPETVLNRLPAKNSEFKLYTYLHVKEDAMQLYGFISKEEQEMFELLIGVSGIGPKGALAFCQHCQWTHFVLQFMHRMQRRLQRHLALELRQLRK